MLDVLGTFADGLRNAALMAYEVWWALVLGFLVSAVVQAWVPRARIEASLSGSGARPVALASALASAASALAFQFASTNLVWELGLVLWILIGWQFALAEFFGGLVMIALMALGLRAFVSPRIEARARERAQKADSGHQHHAASSQLAWSERLRSAEAWSDVAHNFRGDWQMLWKEIGGGFLLAGFVGLLPMDVFNALFVTDAPGAVRTVENVVAGPLIAVLSFVCSVGNVPLAAVLWAGGISFAGVMAFIFADLIVLPILAIYRKYYGTAFALRISALMLVTMVAAALVVDAVFGAVGLVPSARPSADDVFGGVALDYKLALNAIALVVFAALIALTRRRGAIDPVCGMTVDRAKALTLDDGGRTVYFCSEHCRHAYAAEGVTAHAR
jgi:YHS domain-containing protein/uncharacterized membrane protein YraQ (UPF0718 family)